MGLFTPSYDKPGKGIDPDAPQKRSFFRFFDIFFRKFGKFIKINLLYVLTSIPALIIVFILSGIVSNSFLSLPETESTFSSIVNQLVTNAADTEYLKNTLIVSVDLFIRSILSFLFMALWGMGPSTAGMTYIMRNFAREEHAWLWSDFKDSVKSNFKQSLIVFFVDIVLFVLFFNAVIFYSQTSGIMSLLGYFVIVIAMIYTMMHFYIYPMIITFDLKLKDIYKNALIFTMGKLPSNLFVLLIILLLHIGCSVAAVLYTGSYALLALFFVVLLELVIFQSFSSFLINFNTYPKMKKYMLDKSN